MVPKPLLEVIGAPASPYSRKLIALLRFRRIPHAVHWGDATSILKERGLPTPKVSLLPTVIVHDDDASRVMIDTTPIIRHLDQRFTRRQVRSIYDPGLAFVDSLIEDFADEWGTKLMFHYRWNFAPDIAYSAGTLPVAIAPMLSSEQALAMGKAFAERQIERLRYVGSNPTTAPIIEAAWVRLLTILNDVFERQRFVLGGRPGAGDFALFGQLSQLALYDPTPRALAADIAPRVIAWTSTAEDLSGCALNRSQWLSLPDLAQTLTPLLEEIGRTYAPLLKANAHAAARGDDSWRAMVDGAEWQQDTFAYQVKCLSALRDEYAELPDQARHDVDQLLAGTGCDTLFKD